MKKKLHAPDPDSISQPAPRVAKPPGQVTGADRQVVQVCLITVGGILPAMTGLIGTLVTAGADQVAVAVADVMGILIAGTLTVAVVDVWKNRR